MKKHTHQIFSASLFLFLSSLFQMQPIGIITGTILAVWVGIINDLLDFRVLFGIHRNFLTHSPISPVVIILFMLAWILGDLLQLQEYTVLFAVLLSGLFELHILLDAFNPSGIPIFPGKTVRIKRIPFDDVKANLLISMAGVVIFIFGLEISF
ncbi:MAG: metal-dependent hydrolase [Promethearchaeota archaeon]